MHLYKGKDEKVIRYISSSAFMREFTVIALIGFWKNSDTINLGYRRNLLIMIFMGIKKSFYALKSSFKNFFDA